MTQSLYKNRPAPTRLSPATRSTMSDSKAPDRKTCMKEAREGMMDSAMEVLYTNTTSLKIDFGKCSRLLLKHWPKLGTDMSRIPTPNQEARLLLSDDPQVVRFASGMRDFRDGLMLVEQARETMAGALVHLSGIEGEAEIDVEADAVEAKASDEAGAPDPERKKRKLNLAPLGGFEAAGYKPPLSKSNREGAAGGAAFESKVAEELNLRLNSWKDVAQQSAPAALAHLLLRGADEEYKRLQPFVLENPPQRFNLNYTIGRPLTAPKPPRMLTKWELATILPEAAELHRKHMEVVASLTLDKIRDRARETTKEDLAWKDLFDRLQDEGYPLFTMTPITEQQLFNGSHI